MYNLPQNGWIIILSEIQHTPEDKCHLFSLIFGISGEKVFYNEHESNREPIKTWKERQNGEDKRGILGLDIIKVLDRHA